MTVLLEDVRPPERFPLIGRAARLNVMMPTSGSGISKIRSNALPGSDVASIWRSFMKAATSLPVMPRSTGLEVACTSGSTFSLQSVHWMSNISSSPYRTTTCGGPRLDALQEVLVAPEEPGDELLLGELAACRTRGEQTGVDDRRRGPVRFRNLLVRVDVLVPAGRNSSFMRSSSGTIWSFHAAHSISAIVSAP